MINNLILEIPVFGSSHQYFEQLMELNDRTNEKKYNDFVLKEYKLDDEHILYFYCMDYIPETGNASLVDQIVPKAPFVFFLLDSKEGVLEEPTKLLFHKYNEIYSTPVFVILKKDPQEFYTKIENDPIIKSNGFNVILIEEKEQFITQKAVAEAIINVIPANI